MDKKKNALLVRQLRVYNHDHDQDLYNKYFMILNTFWNCSLRAPDYG